MIFFRFFIPLIYFFYYCGNIERNDIQRPSPLTLLLTGTHGDVIGVVSSDLGPAGKFKTLTTDGIPSVNYTNIHSDAGGIFLNNKVYILNRLNRDSIQVLDPKNFYLTILEFSVGQKSNPYDILIVKENKAYVSLYGKSELLIIDVTTGSKTGSIDLSSYADSYDKIPEMTYMALDEKSVYLAIQRLNRNDTSSNLIWPPSEYSSILEINIDSDFVVNEYKFQSRNPFSRLKKYSIFSDKYLLVSTPNFLGYNFQIDGGIEAFNLTQKQMKKEFIYSEKIAGGDILDFEIKSETVGYANVQNQDFSTSIQKFNPTTGEKISEIAFFPANKGFVSGMLLLENGYLYLGDSSFLNPGISIFNTNSDDTKITNVPVDIGLRPIEIFSIPQIF